MTLKKTLAALSVATLPLTLAACDGDNSGSDSASAVSYTHLTLPTNREV